jgi:putative heme-binding domain-containing protein
LYVVDDLDQYLANAEEYLAATPLEIHDDLLKEHRPRKEWKFDDLSGAVSETAEGRSFATGRQMFQVASCVACHKLNGVGQELGPDLTKLDPPRSPAELLRDVLEPSHKINEKFQGYSFLTDEGKTVVGMVLEETADEVKVIENPLLSTTPVVLKKSEIEERSKSPVSVMPKGLLDKLTRDEILDLMAYVTARGDKDHALFQGGHDHGHAHGEDHDAGKEHDHKHE